MTDEWIKYGYSNSSAVPLAWPTFNFFFTIVEDVYIATIERHKFIPFQITTAVLHATQARKCGATQRGGL